MYRNQNRAVSPALFFENFHERMFFGVVSLIVLTIALYAYFISATVISVVERTNALRSVKILDTKISALESEYMAYGASIDLSFAKTLGYEEMAKIDYAPRTVSLGFASR